jgi:hypothetical protein
LFLTGVVWVLQVVQLPLFLKVHDLAVIVEHRRRNSMLMSLPMLVELITAVWLCWVRSGVVVLTALVLLGVIWVVTFAWYMPQYQRLTNGYDEAIVRRLIAGNWVRSVIWTLRSAIMLYIVGQALPPAVG